jgi:hypothetical protein
MSEQLLTQEEPKPTNGLGENASLFDDQAPEGDAGSAPVPSLDEAQAADAERARHLGWQDKDTYVARGGRESAWVDAGEFLTFHERVEASRKRENIRLQKELDSERAERAKLAAKIEDLEKFKGEFTKARGDIQESALLSERRSALENQDFDRVNAIDSEIMDIRIARKTPATTPAQQAIQGQQIDPRAKEILDDFAADYPVYKDQNMQKLLVKGMRIALEADGTLRDRALLDEAHDTARRIWADRYQAPAPRPAMAETRGSPSGQRNGAARGWNDLTQEARVSLDGFIKSSPTFSGMKLDQARAEILKQADESYFRTR